MKDWLTKWGLWILLLLIFIVYLISKLIPNSQKKNNNSWLISAKKEVERLKQETQDKLTSLTKKIQTSKKRMEEIAKISDENERLRKLAELYNRDKS